jgi:hypothetical protein
MKKTYIIPTIEVIEFAAENLIAASIGTNTTTTVSADYALSNKREPASNSWGSENWNTEEEF